MTKYLFLHYRKSWKIIIAIVNLMLIITHNIIKTLKLLFVKNVDILWIKMKKTEKKTFEKDEKNFINNVVI